LVWGCPNCGRVYQPKIISANAMDRVLEALKNREQRGPQPSASRYRLPEERTQEMTCLPNDSRPSKRPPLDVDRVLAWGQRHGWPELILSDWSVLPAGERRWRLFADYLTNPQPTPQAETERLRAYQLARLRIAERDAVTSNVEKGAF